MADRLAAAFAKPHSALVCFVTADDGDTSPVIDAFLQAWSAKLEFWKQMHSIL